MDEHREEELIALRRDLHKYPESGWKEFRTTSIVADRLDSLGFDLYFGNDAVVPELRLGVPDEQELDAARERAIDEGAPQQYLDQIRDITGLVAIKSYGDGPVVGVRVDMDALERTEARDDTHRPAKEGFASVHPQEMHACGHDGHTAIGIGLAQAIESSTFNGTLKLFFQPAEEGGRGGKAMSETTHFDDIDYFLALHIGLDYDLGTVVAGAERPLANAKFDVTYSGVPAHAGKNPESGRNAVQALATAIQNLYSIPRHGEGVTRINVGRVTADNPQNVIGETASMRIDVRGGDTTLKNYMVDRTTTIADSAGEMHQVDTDITTYGETTTYTADETMISAVGTTASSHPSVDTVIKRDIFGASEDAS
jgi:aminobenzoyl-glutamate utilization protein A